MGSTGLVAFAEQEAEVEEERLRKEREERDRQDAMTLGETKEQIQLLQTRLEELRNEKQALFLSLKKVLNEDGRKKLEQQQKDSEMLTMQTMASAPQIFLPPRQQQLMPKVSIALSIEVTVELNERIWYSTCKPCSHPRPGSTRSR